MFSTATRREIERAARDAGMEPAALLAIAEVESGGRAFAVVNGRREPLIRFEGHYFDRLLDGRQRRLARRKGLASPMAGAVRNPASQAARWRLLENAMQIDREAALQSASWGIGQVMGAHWKALGYDSVEALVVETRTGIGGQIRLMLRFLETNGLIDVIGAHDWAAFARAYNGPRYKAHRHDSRIAAAYARHRREGGEQPHPAGLRRGDRGDAVLDLQRMLTAAGYPLTPDGRFGPDTARAVERFQADHGLAASGVAGPPTMQGLSEKMPRSAVSKGVSWLLRRLRRMLSAAARNARLRAGRAG